jgi:predicted S18 family serine protease
MTGWKQNMGMSEDVALVKSYVPDQVKETWKEEADEQGVSLSKYVAAKFEQARAQQHVPQTSNSEEVEKLQQRIAELEDQLDEVRARQPEATATVSN